MLMSLVMSLVMRQAVMLRGDFLYISKPILPLKGNYIPVYIILVALLIELMSKIEDIMLRA